MSARFGDGMKERATRGSRNRPPSAPMTSRVKDDRQAIATVSIHLRDRRHRSKFTSWVSRLSDRARF